MLIHRADTVHSLSCRAGNEPTVIIIGFECSSGEIDLFSKTPTDLDDAEVKKLAEIVKEGRNVFLPPYNTPVYDMKKRREQPFGSEQMLKNLLEGFLIGLLREHHYHLASDGEGGRQMPAVREVVSYVEDNFTEKITLDEIAEAVHLVPHYCCALFSKHEGMGIVEFILAQRIQLAKSLIAVDTMGLAEIAERAGFSDYNYFSRTFKKITGVTASQYRKNTIAIE
jgi:YesN/AraC family two-component response regulator